MKRLAPRLLIALIALFSAVVVFEGAHSILTGRSWLRASSLVAVRTSFTDEDRARIAQATPGPYAVSIDPDVAFTMKPNATWTYHGVASTTDAIGSRQRVGPKPEDGALRIVLVGDSVTYGFGLADDATLASRLESRLAAAMPTEQPRPAVFTLAVPGWNTTNCCRALSDHVARFDPDVVIYTPVANDLYDSFATTEAGYRSHGFDPAVGGTRPHVSHESFLALLTPMAQRMSTADAVAFKAAGGLFAIPPAAVSGVTRESERRWAAFDAEVSRVRDTLRARRCQLAVNLWFDEDFEWMVARRCGAMQPGVAIVPPFAAKTNADLLEGDAHPNADCVDARAACIARWLVDRGWLGECETDALQPVPDGYLERWRPLPTAESIAERCDALLDKWESQFIEEIDLDRARGFHQLYGGVAADCTVGRAFAGALRMGEGDRLRLRIERLPLDSGVYPLRLRIVEEVSSSDVEVEIPEPPSDAAVGDPRLIYEFEAAFEQRPAARGDLFDVTVHASAWVAERAEETTRLASFRLRRIGF